MPTTGLMARQFDLAFHDLEKGIPNREKLMIFADNHYVNGLNTAQFYSSLLHSPHASSIIGNFTDKTSHLHTEHLLIETRLKSMKRSFTEQLHDIGVSKKRHSVLFTAAAIICGAMAGAVGPLNVGLMSAQGRAVIGATGAMGTILFVALGKWRQSALKRRETAVKKHKEIAENMSAGAGLGMKYIINIHNVALRLLRETESLSEAIHYGEKLAAVTLSFQELLRNDEAYSKSLESVKQEVLVSLRGL